LVVWAPKFAPHAVTTMLSARVAPARPVRRKAFEDNVMGT
jgi:hypothetical protein